MKNNVRKRRIKNNTQYSKKGTEREQKKRRIMARRKIGYVRYYGGKREIREER